MMRRGISFLFFVGFTFFLPNLYAQTLEWDLDYFGFTDNREYKQPINLPQTIFGNRFTGLLGVAWDSVHRIRFGANQLYDFGVSGYDQKPTMVGYYQFQSQKYDLQIGRFPRTVIKDYPYALFIDTLMYYRPNLEGMYVQKKSKYYKQSLWIDWTGKQADSVRESFVVGLSGELNYNGMFISHHAIMYHDALPKVQGPNDHIRDNGGGSIRMGLKKGELGFLDSLVVSGGLLMSVDRRRGIYDFRTPRGFIFEWRFEKKGVGTNITGYMGEPLALAWGDRFYQQTEYLRFDFFFTPIRFKNVEGKFNFVFHYTTEGVTHSQQQFFLRARIGGAREIKFR